MKSPELLSVHDSDECFVLKEIDNEGFPSTNKIWISRSDFAIRKYENSFGQTAEEIEEELQKLEADAAASGLRPPRRDVEYHPMKSTTRYIYEAVEFDAPVLK